MKIWESIVNTLDSQINVKDGLFFSDLPFLASLPAIPFFLAAFLTGTPSTAATVLVALAFVAMVLWTIFIFKRRKIKKQNYAQPTRFSDDNNGY